MLRGELYRDTEGELAADLTRARELYNEFNTSAAEDVDRRAAILHKLLGHFGDGARIIPPFRCDFGYLIEIGAGSFINYESILLDCAKITIGENVQIGPRVQLLTALHPMEDHEARRQGWESAAPITIGDNVWFGGGVIVCAGVTIGADTVVGAGSVVTRDLPSKVFAAGNPCRVIRKL